MQMFDSDKRSLILNLCFVNLSDISCCLSTSVYT